MMKFQLVLFFLLSLFFMACTSPEVSEQEPEVVINSPYLVVLGTAQDAGYPQAACKKDCCKPVWEGIKEREMVSCLAYVDPEAQAAWIFDATPDFKDQLQYLESDLSLALKGIFLTHAHIGHYTGLMHLGREVMGSQELPVFVMPKMAEYLSTNGPWSQLVNFKNISLVALQKDKQQKINENFQVIPLQVPHRDEFSETVGYSIQGPNKKALFIPDIDKWNLWEYDIDSVIQAHDLAFLDGSFFTNGEIPGRDMSEIPHPFVEESLLRFRKLEAKHKRKIHFIHFNHTNPILDKESAASKKVEKTGMKIARSFQRFPL